jgi:thiamine pyrophosphate-dependent acetolactate synthase large subunit-like protein
VVSAAWQSVVPGDLLVAAEPEAAPFAVPAAVAARLVSSEVPAIAFTDAGGLESAAEALETTARLGLALAVIVAGGGPAAVALACRLGGAGVRASTEHDVVRALDQARAGRAPLVIALHPDPDPASSV